MTTPRDRLVRNVRVATGALVLSAVGATGLLTVVADAATPHDRGQQPDSGTSGISGTSGTSSTGSSFWGTGSGTTGIGPGGSSGSSTGSGSHAS
ncbi:hypothetical protein [Nocardioides rubriscoriae]|uniref:hypothetical protein n=1 Tax=Nocardioides rubriscoriae TaxID=642762 RepID=UPI0014792530|nr:hypothetical protein [Nocardioides rubriscoriae]